MQVLAQGTPRVRTPEESTPLQLWYQTEGQFLEPVRQCSGQQVEAIGGVCLEPLLDQVGELYGCADKASDVGLDTRPWRPPYPTCSPLSTPAPT